MAGMENNELAESMNKDQSQSLPSQLLQLDHLQAQSSSSNQYTSSALSLAMSDDLLQLSSDENDLPQLAQSVPVLQSNTHALRRASGNSVRDIDCLMSSLEIEQRQPETDYTRFLRSGNQMSINRQNTSLIRNQLEQSQLSLVQSRQRSLGQSPQHSLRPSPEPSLVQQPQPNQQPQSNLAQSSQPSLVEQTHNNPKQLPQPGLIHQPPPWWTQQPPPNLTQQPQPNLIKQPNLTQSPPPNGTEQSQSNRMQLQQPQAKLTQSPQPNLPQLTQSIIKAQSNLIQPQPTCGNYTQPLPNPNQSSHSFPKSPLGTPTPPSDCILNDKICDKVTKIERSIKEIQMTVKEINEKMHRFMAWQMFNEIQSSSLNQQNQFRPTQTQQLGLLPKVPSNLNKARSHSLPSVRNVQIGCEDNPNRPRSTVNANRFDPKTQTANSAVTAIMGKSRRRSTKYMW